ncbi:protein LURP-one-related 12-like [Lycium barbarum]|uniref:protein LURP-one-related 12-like n=1 Tax=Lycium barbarum TaxID=112863 RepID=UPI00293E9356|nr:protein LURP-one-related 12-like [Lycium barbarum]
MEGKVAEVIEDALIVYKEEETNLTVLKTSLFFTGDGFAAYDCKGEMVFRVDTYNPDSRDQRPSLHQRWEGYLGELIEGQKPIFSVRRSSMMGSSTVTVEGYSNNAEEEYEIDGSFAERSCTFLNAEKESVAEIRRKVDANCDNVMLDKDVFSLSVKPGFDGAFAMGLVLVLDQILADDCVSDEDPIADDPLLDCCS